MKRSDIDKRLDITALKLKDPHYLDRFGPRKIKVDPTMLVTSSNIHDLLTYHGYESFQTEYQNFRITGHNIHGYYIIEDTDHYYSGYIMIDHKDCYDKLPKCPVSFSLPITAKELFTVLKQIGSDAGLRISRSFHYINNNPFLFHDKPE